MMKWLMPVLIVGVASAGAVTRANATAHHDGGVLAGQVVDAMTHEVLDSVRVQVKGSDLAASTDSEGSFALDKLIGDKVALVISRSGYKSREVRVFVTKTPMKWTVALWPAR